jgi:serine/threonine protein kinase/WD40 repeat protein
VADLSDDPDVLLNQLADEFATRQRNGERPRLEEYCKRYPNLADEIRSLFPALVELERVKDDAGDQLAVTATTLPPITELGDFRLLREVGRGGMGVVYEAEQVSLGRRVAIKLLPATVFRDPAKRRRFEREAKAAAKLHHTNIVPVHGFGEHDGTPYYVMQFIPGLGLDAVIHELGDQSPGGQVTGSNRPLSGAQTALSVALAHSLAGDKPRTDGRQSQPDDDRTLTITDGATPSPAQLSRPDLGSSALLSTSGVHLPGQAGPTVSGAKGSRTTYWQSVARIGVQVAGALAYAHKLGVLHRDIKPANLLLDLDGIVWVTDFGLAKADDSDNLTHTGDVLGTLRYMPPEAFEGKSDARSDIYALGLTLFELVALRPAYEIRDQKRLIKQLTTGEPPRLRKLRKDAPRDLVTIVEKAIDRDPVRRYQTAADLGADLQHLLDDEPIKARRQTAVEAVWRWARQHTMVASLAAVVVLLLIAITIGSVVTAAYFRDLERGQRLLAQTKLALAERNQRLAEENDAAKKKAVDAQNRAQTTLVDMQTSRGLMAAERNDPARALLWFTQAAEDGAADTVRTADNLLRARNWARHLTVPLRAFPQPSVRFLEFRTGGDLLLLHAGDRLFVRDWRADTYLPWCNDVAQVGAASWSRDGEMLAIGYQTGTLQVRSVPDGRILHDLKLPGPITSLAFSTDSKHLAVAGTTARILVMASGTLLPSEWKHPQQVHSMTFNRAGTRLITACHDKKARVFAVAGDSGQPAPLFEPLPHEPHFSWPPALFENDRRLITVSSAGADGGKSADLTSWDIETGKPVGPGMIRTRIRIPSGVVASPQGDWFATGGLYGPQVWQTNDNDAKVLLTDHTGRIEDFIPGPDGKTLLTSSWDQTARLWSMPDGKPLGSPLPHMGIVTRCAFARDNVHLATWADGIVRIWKRSDGDVADTRPVKWQGIPRPSFDGRLIAPGIWHEMPYTFSPLTRTAQPLVVTTTDGSAAGPAITLRGLLVDSCICADNHTLAVVSEEKTAAWLSLTDVVTRKAVAEPIRLPASPRSVAARPTMSQVAVLCASGELLVFDSRSGERVLNVNHDGPTGTRLSRVEYTADGSALVTLTESREQTIQVRDATTGQLRFPPIRPVLNSGPLRSFALSADSRMVVTAVNGKNAVQVWDLETGQALSEPLAHPGDHYGLFCVCFSPDGRRLLTGCTDGQARLWDWKAGVLACPPLKHDDQVLSVAMTPDGRFAVTTGRSAASKLHVWELTTGRLVAPKIPLPLNAIAALAVSPTGSRVVAASPFVGSMGRVDLSRLLAVPEMSIEDYRLLGEVTSGQRIEQGDESGLTQEQWLRQLKLFNQKHP